MLNLEGVICKKKKTTYYIYNHTKRLSFACGAKKKGEECKTMQRAKN